MKLDRSLPRSEAPSLRRSELETDVAEGSYPRKLSMPASQASGSRFREEFDVCVPPNASSRISFLTKLHLTIPEKAKTFSRGLRDSVVSPKSGRPETDLPRRPGDAGGEKTKTRHLSRANNRSGMNHTISGSRSTQLRPDSDEMVADMWQRAVQRASATYLHRGSSTIDLQSTTKEPGRDSRVKRPKRWIGDNPRSRFSEQDVSPLHSSRNSDESVSLDLGLRTKNMGTAARLYQQPGHTDHAPGGRFAEMYKNWQPNKSSVPPESWSRWPSHTRDDRAGPAGSDDSVDSRDFAISSVAPSGRIHWATDVSTLPLAQGVRSFSGKLGRAVKSGFTKIRVAKSEDFRHSLGGRRGSSQTGGSLEYPELEILPTEAGYQELKALEREIEAMKGRQANRQGSAIGLGVNIHSNLARRLSAMFQEVDHRGHGCSRGGPSSERLLVEPETLRPETPSFHPDHVRDSTTETTERYVTPPSRISSSGTGSVRTAREHMDDVESLGASRRRSSVSGDWETIARSSARQSRSSRQLFADAGVEGQDIELQDLAQLG